jgi:hypothetical protein
MTTRICLSGLLILACLGAVGIITQHRQLRGLKDQRGQILAQLSGPLDGQLGSTASGEESAKSGAGDSGSAGASRELLQLRNQLGQLTERKRELTGVRDQNNWLRGQFASRPGGEKLLPPDYIRKSSAQWVGLSTPENTLQSFLWTLQNRDLTNLFQVLTPEGAQRLSQMLTNEPNNFFAQSAAIPGMRIAEKNALPDGSFELKVETVPGTPLPGPVRIRLVGNDWKLDFP